MFRVFFAVFAAFFVTLVFCSSVPLRAAEGDYVPSESDKNDYENWKKTLSSPVTEAKLEEARKIISGNPKILNLPETSPYGEVGSAIADAKRRHPEFNDFGKYTEHLNLLVENGRKPLPWEIIGCASFGHTEIVEFGLDHGVDVNSKDEQDYSILHRALENKFTLPDVKFKLTKRLVEGGAELNGQTKDAQKTPLNFALKFGNEEMTKYLINNGADVNVGCYYGQSPLHVAAQHSNLETVKFLLENGANINATEPWGGDTPLFYAAGNVDLEIFKYLREKGAVSEKHHPVEYALRCKMPLENVKFFFENPDFPPSEECKKTVIAIACRGGLMSLETIKYLFENGCDINGTDYSSNAIELAILSYAGPDCMEVIRFLLDHGAEINNHERGSHSALFMALSRQEPYRSELVKLLMKNGADISISDSVQKPVFAGFSSSLQYLLNLGIDVNHKDANGNTLLHHAASSYTHLAVENLLKHKADPNAKGKDDRTPLFSLGSRFFTMQKVELLLDAGAEVNARDVNGDTPLRELLTYVTLDNLKTLKEKGADLTVKNNDGQTLLFRLTRSGWREEELLLKMDFILEQDVDLNAKDKHGRTALFYAAGLGTKNPDWRLVQHFSDKGATLNLKDDSGQTPLHIAADAAVLYTHPVVTFFVEKGLDVNAKDENGLTPLMLSVLNSDTKEMRPMASSMDYVRNYRPFALTQFLLEKGAEVNAQDNNGQTALHKASQVKNGRIAAILIEAGADPKLLDNAGQPALSDDLEVSNPDLPETRLFQGGGFL